MRYTDSNKPLQVTEKQSFKAFMKSVWVLSQTNMHYIDFVEVHGDALKSIYKPVKVGAA